MLRPHTRARWLRAEIGLQRPLCGPSRCCRYFHASWSRSTSTTLQGGSAGGELAKIIKDSIKATGPLPVSRYIQLALSHPQYGYYAKGDVFGRQGDFITSPEISQVFGELIAIWFVTRYMAEGQGRKCRIIELGPGRGTLMDDMLRTLSSFRAIRSSIAAVYLVENSDKMRQLQSAKLGRRCEEGKIPLQWSDKIDDVPKFDGYTFIVAHEFFDAMPINIFQNTQEGWREVVVDAESPSTTTSASTSSGLRLSISREPTTLSTILPRTSPRFASLPVGFQVEIAHESWKISRRLGELLQSHRADNDGPSLGGGAGLIVDYGGDRAYANSFRAFRDHKLVPIFDLPGSSDLTANVDFAYLKESLADTGARPLGPISQRDFLSSLGLEARTQQLLDSAPPERREDIRKGVDRLVNPLGMGTQYQVMGITSAAQGEDVYPFVHRVAGIQDPSEGKDEKGERRGESEGKNEGEGRERERPR